MQRDPARRPTPAQILQHPWLCEAAPDRPLEQVVGRLARLHALNKVHRAAMVSELCGEHAAPCCGHLQQEGLGMLLCSAA